MILKKILLFSSVFLLLILCLPPSHRSYAEETDAAFAQEDLPTVSDFCSDTLSVYSQKTDDGYTFIQEVLNGTGSYFARQNSFLYCHDEYGHSSVCYCIEPTRAAPGSTVSYRDLAFYEPRTEIGGAQLKTFAILTYGFSGYGGSCNAALMGDNHENDSYGGTYGVYVINGVAQQGLMINGAFYKMTPTEAYALCAAIIHKANGADVGTVTGSKISDNDADIAEAATYLEEIAEQTYQKGYSENSFFSGILQLDQNPQESLALSTQVQKPDGTWTDIPSDSQNGAYDWSRYNSNGYISFRVTYNASYLESKLLPSPNAGRDGNITYSHKAETIVAFNEAKNGCYDYFRITESPDNQVAADISYGALESTEINGQGFSQKAVITVKASDIADGKKLDLKISTGQSASRSPGYGDADNDGESAYGVRYFQNNTYQNIALGSPNKIVKPISVSLYAEGAMGRINLIKNSSEQTFVKSNSCYSLLNAEYGIYKDYADAEKMQNQIAFITTDSDGKGTSPLLAPGKYYIKETKAPQGYRLDSAIYNVNINSSMSVPLYVSEAPQHNASEILLQKTDESGTPLQNAVFEVKYFDVLLSDNPVNAGFSPRKTWLLRTDKNGYAGLKTDHLLPGSDSFYYNAAGTPVLPIGTITIQEISAPEGYIADNKVYSYMIEDDKGNPVNTVSNERQYKNKKIRQPFQFIKLGEAANGETNPLAHAGFMACPADTLATDSAGKYIWDFSKAVALTPDGATELFTDENGYACSIPLPYGTYVVRETTVPENYLPIQDFLICITEDSDIPQPMRYFTDKSFKAYLRLVKQDEESKKSILSNPGIFKIWSYDTEAYITFRIYNGSGHTETSELQTNEQGELITPECLSPGKYRIDEITAPQGYYNSMPDRPLDFEIKDSGIYEVYCDTDGNVTDMGIFTVYMQNTPLSGQIELYKTGETYKWLEDSMSFETNIIPLEGITFDIIAAEDIYKPDGQGTLIYPKNTTVETVTTDKNGYAISSDTLPLGAYMIREHTPTAYMPADDIYVELSAEATITEQSIESVTKKKVLQTLTVHNTLKLPQLSTTARDSATGTNIGRQNEQTTLIDTVTYGNLIPGEEYTIRGVVMDGETGLAYKEDGKSVVGETTFICGEASGTGTIEVTFSLDTSSLYDKNLVLFETLYHDGSPIAAHADLNCKQQTVSYPAIPELPNTGDGTPILPIIILGFLSSLSFIFLFNKKRLIKFHKKSS